MATPELEWKEWLMSKGQGRSGFRPAVNTRNTVGPFDAAQDKDGLTDHNGGYSGPLPKSWPKTTTSRDTSAWRRSKEGQG